MATVEQKVNIGDKRFHIKLDSFIMADRTSQVEGRIDEVEIIWVHQYKKEPLKYIIQSTTAKVEWWFSQELHALEWELFRTEEVAKDFLQKKINKISITISKK